MLSAKTSPTAFVNSEFLTLVALAIIYNLVALFLAVQEGKSFDRTVPRGTAPTADVR